MSIIKAIRMSISIPLIIGAVKYQGKSFIDGGFHDPCPAYMFPIKNTLLFRINNSNSSKSDNEYDFVKHIGYIITSIQKRLNVKSDILKKYKTVWLKTGITMLSLDLKKRQRLRLIEIGYKTTFQYLKNNNFIL